MREGLGDPSGTRLVALSDDLCGLIYHALAHSYPSSPEKADEFHRAWKASPADPAEAVQGVLVERYGTVFEGTPSARYFAEDVLVALGVPANPANEDHHA